MAKKEKIKEKIKKHIIHKSKLSFLLILKMIFVIVSFSLVVVIFSIISPWARIEVVSVAQLIYWSIGLTLGILLYLSIIIKILKIMKFE
ncbi:MAG: hypothetical protein NUV46_04125 [Nanoarchaeota archaeon]|nr:hypothetical protein [Nanoarchaeota archaeon]